MSLALILKLIHVFAAFWLITGIIGRNITIKKAEQSLDIQSVGTLLPLASIFEARMVIPGSFAVLIAGLVTAWVQGWPILGVLQGGASNWVLVSLLLFFSLIPVIRFIFLPRGKVFEAAYHEAQTLNQVTPELRAAFRDPVVRAAHLYEVIILGVITALMVLKPF
jgi:hypothetical protein